MGELKAFEALKPPFGGVDCGGVSNVYPPYPILFRQVVTLCEFGKEF